jgi:hypothetical protein
MKLYIDAIFFYQTEETLSTGDVNFAHWRHSVVGLKTVNSQFPSIITLEENHQNSWKQLALLNMQKIRAM